VIGIKYQDGVMMAADTLASYGSLARYKDVRRIKIIGDKTLIGASGEISDFQSIICTNKTLIKTMDSLERRPKFIPIYAPSCTIAEIREILCGTRSWLLDSRTMPLS
jgi:hypothetical protein